MYSKDFVRPYLRKSRNKRYGINPSNFHVDAYLRYLNEEIEIEQALADDTDDICCESHDSDIEARISTEFLTGKKPRPYITHYSQDRDDTWAGVRRQKKLNRLQERVRSAYPRKEHRQAFEAEIAQIQKEIEEEFWQESQLRFEQELDDIVTEVHTNARKRLHEALHE